MRPGRGSTPSQTDWLTVSRNVTQTHTQTQTDPVLHPCGGGFEYLQCDPASRRRRRKGKSQIWDSKIWSRVSRDYDLKKITLTRTNNVYKRQTRPLVREGALKKQDRNCQRVINIWSCAPHEARHLDLLIDCPSVAMWLWLAAVNPVWRRVRMPPP
jgi:hypothetical protein